MAILDAIGCCLNEGTEMPGRYKTVMMHYCELYCFPQDLDSIHCCCLGCICPLYEAFWSLTPDENKLTKPLASAICTRDENSQASTKKPISLSAWEAADKIHN